MNETKALNSRQKEILNAISLNGNISRASITEKLPTTLSASKATIARDLRVLQNKKLIKAVGSGPSTAYQPTLKHPLLSHIDLKQYFAIEPDQRQQVKSEFNQNIFSLFPGLISKQEEGEFEEIFRSFKDITSNINSTIVERELERYIIELSWKSSKIEGNTYTLLETENLIKRGIEAKGKTKYESTMILNHKEAFKLILDNKKQFSKLAKRDIFELHNILTQDLNISSGIRKNAVGITGTTYTPPANTWELDKAISGLIQLVNNTDHPLEKAVTTSALLAYIQPFADGNKRTARMMANAILLSHDYFPLSYRNVDENEYKQALIIFYETNNMYHLKRIFLDQYRFAVKNYFPEP